MGDRYKATGSQSEFQPDSDEQVLRNRLGITDPDEINDIELDLLGQLYETIFSAEFPNRRLTVSDLQFWHHQWLGNVYSWAGEIRTVNVSKEDFSFAAATQVPRLLGQFQETCLDLYTPANELADETLAEAMAVTHVELILIHPFREGNGRLARLLSDVMAVQAGRGLLDYSEWDRHKEQYFAAIRLGVSREYGAMEELFLKALNN